MPLQFSAFLKTGSRSGQGPVWSLPTRCGHPYCRGVTITLTSPPDLHQPPASRVADRRDLVTQLAARLDDSGVPWAWQGDSGAVDRWCADDGPADLDVWVPTLPGALTAWLDGLPAARIASADDRRRLRHVSWAVPVGGSLAVVDLTVGDLRVGPVLLLSAADVQQRRTPAGPRLDRAAAVADLFLRPLLRGRVVSGPRLAEARAAWADTPAPERSALFGPMAAGSDVAASVRDLLDDAGEVSPDDARSLVRGARRQLIAATLAPRSLPATWAERRSILPAGRSAGPLGLRTRGAVVALVGTDGSGKSSVSSALAGELAALGVPTRSVYFGMARGNLPGVTLARRLLGIRQETGEPVAPVEAEPSVAPTGPSAADAAPASLSHIKVRRAAAWFYAGEYAWRWARHVAPGLARREVVICDRWVTDLRESPWPGSAASAFVERLVPSPDVLVLPDAPDALIHARKPERSAAEQARQQQVFRDLVAERPARIAEVVVDTSGTGPDVRRLVATTLTALHLPASTSGR